jgi:surface protein
MEIMMIVHDKPVRLLDNHILRNRNQSKWDIIRMEEIYGPIEEWDTSWITDMSYAFSLHFTFDRNISKWDISSVKNMEGMFFNAYSFSQDISNWNISNVKNLEGIFNNAFDFNSRYLPKRDNKPAYESILS